MAARGARAEALGLLQQLEAEYRRYRESVSWMPATNIRHQEDMRRYLCLRFSGFLEKITKVIILDYIHRKSGGPIRNFAVDQFKVPNLTPEKFDTLLKKFGDECADSFNKHLGLVHRQALSDLLDIRNKVAHGDIQGGVKLDPERYMRLVTSVYEWMLSYFIDDD